MAAVTTLVYLLIAYLHISLAQAGSCDNGKYNSRVSTTAIDNKGNTEDGYTCTPCFRTEYEVHAVGAVKPAVNIIPVAIEARIHTDIKLMLSISQSSEPVQWLIHEPSLVSILEIVMVSDFTPSTNNTVLVNGKTPTVPVRYIGSRAFWSLNTGSAEELVKRELGFVSSISWALDVVAWSLIVGKCKKPGCDLWGDYSSDLRVSAQPSTADGGDPGVYPTCTPCDETDFEVHAIATFRPVGQDIPVTIQAGRRTNIKLMLSVSHSSEPVQWLIQKPSSVLILEIVLVSDFDPNPNNTVLVNGMTPAVPVRYIGSRAFWSGNVGVVPPFVKKEFSFISSISWDFDVVAWTLTVGECKQGPARSGGIGVKVVQTKAQMWQLFILLPLLVYYLM